MPASDLPINAPSLVLDTNVVLDLLVFGNAGVDPVFAAVRAGSVRWVATPDMRAELLHVLTAGALQGRLADAQQALTLMDSLCHCVPAQPDSLPRHRPRCSDPSDQMFVDLALQVKAGAVLSRDRALLKMDRKLAPWGVRVRQPEDWNR